MRILKLFLFSFFLTFSTSHTEAKENEIIPLSALTLNEVRAITKIKPKEYGYELAVAFSRCAALFDTMKDAANLYSEQDVAEHYETVANGADVAAKFFATYSGISKADTMVKSRYETEYTSFKILLKNEGVQSANFDEPLSECMNLNPLQAEIVEEIRKKLYGLNLSGNEWVK